MQPLLPIFCFCFLVLGCSQKESNPIEIDVTDHIVAPNQYVVNYTETTLKIDGIPDSSWKQAPFTNSFIDITGEPSPYFDTKAKMLWDSSYLYVYAELEEAHIWGDLKQKDTVIFYNNDFEVFIDPSNDTRNYAEIEVNALNTVWDLNLDKPYRVGGKAKNNYDMNGLKTGVHHYGTINNSTDIDSMWTVEIAIPMTALVELKNKPRSLPQQGEYWRLNFSRVQWQHDLIARRYNRKMTKHGNLTGENNWVWSNQKVVNMHEPEKWGIIFFNTPSSTTTDFHVDYDLELEQTVYAVFREIRWGDYGYLLNEKSGTNFQLDVTYTANDNTNGFFVKTNKGFEIGLECAKENCWYCINEEGFFFKTETTSYEN